MNFDKKIIFSNSLQIYTESFGDNSNPTCLLISGAMSHAHFWTDEFCEKLANGGYFVIRYDHRDAGLSSAVDYSKNSYDLNDLAKDAIAILEAYGIEKAHMIGDSMGGLLAQLLAMDYKDRVLSVVVIASPTFVKEPQPTAEEQKILDKTLDVMFSNKPTKNYEESVDGFLRSNKHLNAEIPMDEDVAKAYIKDMYERSKPEHIEWYERFSKGTDVMHNHVKAMQNAPDRSKDLKQLKIPVLIIHGEKDPLILPRLSAQLAAKTIPGAKLKIIPGMGHMFLNHKLYDQIAGVILEFLKKFKKRKNRT